MKVKRFNENINENKNLTSQEKYEYIADKLTEDFDSGEKFAYWSGVKNKRDVLYDLVKQWQEDKENEYRGMF